MMKTLKHLEITARLAACVLLGTGVASLFLMGGHVVTASVLAILLGQQIGGALFAIRHDSIEA